MTRKPTVLYLGILTLLGAGWGLTLPLTKIAVSTGYQPFGLIFWQMLIGTVVMSLCATCLGKRLPNERKQWAVCLFIALIGSVLPNSASYVAAVHLPAGVMSILLSMVPIWAFPIALLLSLDGFEWRRFAGLLIGLSAVLLLVLPNAELNSTIPVVWIMVGLIAGLFYAFEGNYVSKWGIAGMDPIQLLWGASIVGSVITLPLALATGQWISPLPPYGAPDIAQIASSTIHVLVYVGYVWLVSNAGPVFAVQISYLVTLFGVFWASLILGESYPTLVWGALALMILGMALVQPRNKRAVLDTAGSVGESDD